MFEAFTYVAPRTTATVYVRDAPALVETTTLTTRGAKPAPAITLTGAPDATTVPSTRRVRRAGSATTGVSVADATPGASVTV